MLTLDFISNRSPETSAGNGNLPKKAQENMIRRLELYFQD